MTTNIRVTRRPGFSLTGNPLSVRMAAVLGTLAKGEGFSPSLLPGVRFMRSVLHVPRTPVAYTPGIFIVAQGRKWGHAAKKTYLYDPDHYLVLSVPMPFECETYGTPEIPLLGLSVGVTPSLVAELLVQMDHPSPAGRPPRAMESGTLDDSLRGAALRLVEALRSASETRILGPQLVREIVYRVLCGRLGANLRALAAPHSHFGQISRVLNRLHTDFAQTTDMETLAREAGMSVSTFHAHFKTVTAASPLQYLKKIRLHKARMLMVHDGTTAGDAAHRVGYESVSQFSREFKRLFKTTPATEAAGLRESLIRLA